MCILSEVLSSCKQEENFERAPSRANRFEPSSGLSSLTCNNQKLIAWGDWSTPYDCKHNQRLLSYTARTEKGNFGLRKKDCFPLFEPHLEGISLFADDSGHMTAGVTLYALSCSFSLFSFFWLRLWRPTSCITLKCERFLLPAGVVLCSILVFGRILVIYVRAAVQGRIFRSSGRRLSAIQEGESYVRHSFPQPK